MNYYNCQIYYDASMTIFTSILSPILVSKYAGYFREQIKDKNSMKTQTILIVHVAQNANIVNTTGRGILNDQVVQSCWWEHHLA